MQLAGAPGTLRRRARSGQRHVVGVVSGRGGSGVSLVSAMLALRSAATGLRTLLVDADPWLDMQRIWLGMPRGLTLESLRGGEETPESLVRQVAPGIELVSFGAGDGVERDHRALVRRVPSLFASRDAVVVDAGSRLESLGRCVDLQAGSILVVSGSDAVSLASTHALMKAMHARVDVAPEVLFNRVTDDEAEAGEDVLSEGAERFLGLSPSVVGHLPDDDGLRAGLANGATLPEALAGSTLTGLTASLMPGLRPWRTS